MSSDSAIEEAICKFLFSRRSANWAMESIQHGIHEQTEYLSTPKLESLLEKMCEKGTLTKSYMVEYKDEAAEIFDTLEDIPDIIDNPIVNDWEDGEICTTGPFSYIRTHYAHKDWKPEDPEVTFWKHPPYVYKEEHREYVLEHFDCDALTWSGEWFLCELDCLQPGDIWKPSDIEAPEDKLHEEAKEVRADWAKVRAAKTKAGSPND